MEPPALIEPPSLLRDPPAIVVKEDPYAAVLRQVLAGKTVFTDAIPGEPKGKYRCFLGADGKPKYEAVPAVAVPKPFRGPVHHVGHDCPRCGYEQSRTPITGYSAGGHTHQCPKCSQEWFH